MKTVLIIVVSVIAAIGLVVLVISLIGWRLPKEHSASRSVLIHKTPDSVYAVARDFASMPKWRSDVSEVQVTKGADGRVHFREDGSNGPVNYELEEDVAGQRMVTRITDTDLGYSGKWTYVFTPEGPNTRVTITEDGVVTNVIFRFLSGYAFGHTATMDTYLKSLGKHFGETVKPE
ncbi:MAG TPA: SRPBCC family protein [Pyrinomonadaceae bacterium]|nr:SRPBCC family protein [Pyrinomonadaceae bacterium]